MNSVWRKADTFLYVQRCSVCGKYEKELVQHWFFSGIYCVGCVQDRLYDNCRLMREIT